MSLKYHAVLVNNKGIVEYIRPAGTMSTEREMIKYWTKGRYKEVQRNSFIATSPVRFKEGDKVE